MEPKREPLTVFVSYSRADESIADYFVNGLKLAGFSVTIDRHSIHGGDVWRSRLGALIAESDTVVFLLSPDSARSEMCKWEVQEAVALNKRILPICVKPMDGQTPTKELVELHYIDFDLNNADQTSRIMSGIHSLVAALNVDATWLRRHTRLLTRAREWDEADEARSRLLRGRDVRSAQELLASRPPNAPEFTDLQLKFIDASAAFETEALAAEKERVAAVEKMQKEHSQNLAEKERTLVKLNRRALLSLGGTALFATTAGIGAYQARAWNRAFSSAQAARFQDAERSDVEGELIVYSTSPGGLAMDGVGENSPFVESLLETLSNTDYSIIDALLKANHLMARKSGGQQQPFLSTSLTGEIFLHRVKSNMKVRALLVGNSEYEGEVMSLKNPVRDVQRISEAVSSFCASKHVITDCNTEEFEEGLNEVIQVARADVSQAVNTQPAVKNVLTRGLSVSTRPADQIDPVGGVCILFYAGHGISMEGDLYFGMVDCAYPKSFVDFKEQLSGWYRVSGVRDRLASVFQTVIIIADSCRNSPFEVVSGR